MPTIQALSDERLAEYAGTECTLEEAALLRRSLTAAGYGTWPTRDIPETVWNTHIQRAFDAANGRALTITPRHASRATWYRVVTAGTPDRAPEPPHGPWTSLTAAWDALARWRRPNEAWRASELVRMSTRIYTYPTRAAARAGDISDSNRCVWTA